MKIMVNEVILDKEAYEALHMAALANGGVSKGAGNPWFGECGCLLSLGAWLDGREDMRQIYTAPTESEPVLTALWAAFDAPVDPWSGNGTAEEIYTRNDNAFFMSKRISWEDFCRRANIVPSE